MKKNQRLSGQALVEFALVFPLIILIIIVFINLGRIVYFYSALTNAVREGARFAVVTQFPSSSQRQTDIRQKVVAYSVTLPLTPANVSIYCDQDPTDTSNPCDNYVTVSAQLDVDPIAAFLAKFFGTNTPFRIKAESTMQMTPFGVSGP